MVTVKAASGPVGRGPLESIRGVDLLKRGRGFRFTATSLPGHLIHFIVSGRVRQACNGRVYDLRPGDLVWYHENEWVEGEVQKAPWLFYSVNFLAPSLPPPDYARRVWRPRGDRVRLQFQLLQKAWKSPGGWSRDLLCHGHLLLLLAAMDRPPLDESKPLPELHLWWDLEVKVRTRLDRPYRLADLAALAQRSPATLSRSCHQATGQSPLRRIKQIRLSLAQGLLLHSDLRITEIAHRVGYERPHEFSRDFAAHFGHSPREERGLKSALPTAPR